MINWIKNLYKGDNSVSIPVTIVFIFVIYWFIKMSYRYSPAHAFIFSKGIYDPIISVVIVFLIFRIIFLKTLAIHEWIKNKNAFLWGLAQIVWGLSIVVAWAYISVDVPKITSNIIYKTTDLPKYVITPCSFWEDPQEFENAYTKWTKEEEKEALDFWKKSPSFRLLDSNSFYDKCAVREYDYDDSSY
jgi:hypothetical protein